MEDYRAILKRVGIVLIVVGALDIGVMIYCIANRIAYSSSFNIFAIIAGLFLYRGNLTSARVIAWFAAGYFTCFAVLLLVAFVAPPDLWLTEFRLHPFLLCGELLEIVAVIVVPAWVYRELRSVPVLQARLAAGLTTAPPKIAFIISGLAIVTAVGASVFVQTGSYSIAALRIAQQQYGDGYKYHVSGMRFANGRVWAQLTAFNSNEIKDIIVELPQ